VYNGNGLTREYEVCIYAPCGTDCGCELCALTFTVQQDIVLFTSRVYVMLYCTIIIILVILPLQTPPLLCNAVSKNILQ